MVEDMEKDFHETWGGHGGDGEGRTNGEQEVHDEKGEPKEYQHQHSHFTRSKKRMVYAIERAPKPVPAKHIAMKEMARKKAMKRELDKIMEEDTIHELPKGEDGEDIIFPEDAIGMRLFEILDFKWKVDPDTGEERWLEVIRAVVDGSTDKRDDFVSAQTPDRTLLLLMLSLGATLEEISFTGDAVRTYLNAEAIDRNLVVIVSRFI
jgi:hypothetical protein